MEYRPASGTAARELERLRESGALSEGVSLRRTGSPRSPVVVRPVVDDSADDWMPAVEGAMGVVSGVVAFSGLDMAETAGIAALAAAWLGDRGRSVILVDASVERPVLGKPLPGDGDEGLVDAVLFGVSPSAVVRRTLSPGVSVVTAGSRPLSVESVFDGGRLNGVLRGLADEAVVLVLVPPAHVSSATGTLDAAVCVADSIEGVLSIAASVDGVRTTGLHVREGAESEADAEKGAADPSAEVAAEAAAAAAAKPSGIPPIVLPTHGRPDEAAQAEPAEQEAPPRSEPPRPGTTRPEAEGAAAATDKSRRAAAELGASSRTRTRSDPLPTVVAVAVILVIAAVIWWSVDGQRRFQSRSDRPVHAGPGLVTGTADSVRTDEAAQATTDSGAAAWQDGTAEVEAAPGEEGRADAPAGAAGERDGSGEGVGAVAAVVPPSGGRPAGGATISGPGGSYRIMVSSHHLETSAEVEAAELSEMGVAAEVTAAEIAGRGTWYRVLVSGGYPTLARARAVLDTIKGFGYEGAWIERAPRDE